MHDIKAIRENPEAFEKSLDRRNKGDVLGSVLHFDREARDSATELQAAQARRNEVAKQIGQAMKAGDTELAEFLKAEAEQLKVKIPDLERNHQVVTGILQNQMARLPNLLLDDVPDGEDENDNQVVHTIGEAPGFAFEPKEHFDLDVGLDFETGVKLAGSRFTVMLGYAGRLHRALGQYMLDYLSNAGGYDEVHVPLLVKDEVMFGTGQLPKFEEDLFRTTDGRWLIPTAEVSITNMVREQILSEGELPLRFTALTPCFRAEAGSAGRDTRGLIRQHQFEKVEMVSITTPDQSPDEHERMTGCAEKLLKDLDLHFRRVKLCAGDVGFSAAKTYDLEVWLPGQKRFREISSCSTCTDFQARRMNTRYRPTGEKGTKFVHTLNGSGLAVGRALVAVLETYQQEGGKITTPAALVGYMAGRA